MCKIFEKYVTKWIDQIRDHLDWFVTDIGDSQWCLVQIGFKLLLFSRRIFDPQIEFRNSESSKPNVEKHFLKNDVCQWRHSVRFSVIRFLWSKFFEHEAIFRHFMPKLCVESLCWQNCKSVRSFDCDRKLAFLKRFDFRHLHNPGPKWSSLGIESSS